MSLRYHIAFLVIFSHVLMQAQDDILSSGSRTTDGSFRIVDSTVIIASGEYVVSRSFTGRIDIEADNVIINLNGFVISGTIFSSGFSNITITNGTLRDGFTSCIEIINATNIFLENLLVENALNSNIAIQGSNFFIKNIISQSAGSRGLISSGAISITIENSTFSSNAEHGIFFTAVTGQRNLTINNCFVTNNGDHGVEINNIRESTVIANCIISNNNSTGLLLNSCFPINIKNNTITNNVNNGIEIINSIQVLIERNFTTLNQQNGIVINTLLNYSILNNKSIDNNNGILINNSTIGNVLFNIAGENIANGFNLIGGGSNAFLNNTSRLNGTNYNGSIPFVAIDNVTGGIFTPPGVSAGAFNNVSMI